ncbi:response regulator [Anaeroselena agilis]|uniref:Response regulator n=1 Tax=Anaeroselena agilis TaxID=3063788 RepID=A0ABU3NTY3_9FIRM|nr:response regulator [Selenomonadales bacterium 4137-cl]
MYRLLIVEDEQLERQGIRYIVEKFCADIGIIGEIGDGDSAVEIAVKQQPDIIVMDIRIPGINGLEAIKHIKRVTPECAIIILTAFDEFSYAREAVTLGAAEYLLKPVRPGELVRVLQQVVGQLKITEEKRTEEVQLRQYLDGAMPFIQMSFAHDLLSGYFDDLALLRQRAAFLGLRIDPGVVIVVGVDQFNLLAVDEDELTKQVLKQKIYRSVCEAVGEEALVTPFANDKIIVILGVEQGKSRLEAKDKARGVAGRIRDRLGSDLRQTATVGVGCYHVDARDIYKSYCEAMRAYQQSFFFGTDQVLFFDELPTSNFGPFAYPFQNERAVLEQVRCGYRETAKEKLSFLLEQIFRDNTSIETAKAYALELLIVLSRAAVEGGGSIEKMTLQNFALINRLAECQNHSQVYSLLMNSLDGHMDNMIETIKTVNSRVINRACTFIADNCNRNLTLEEVAHNVHLSPFYFSKVFKKEKGCNFVDFLTKTRVERAKKLLRHPDLSVVRVAHESGYQDASYFCRVFRHEEGMTPNEYRKKFLGQRSSAATK